MLKIQNVKKTFINSKKFTGLRETTFEVNKKEIVSIIGKSGCGKSTLLKLISGLEKTSNGIIELNGKIIDRPDEKIAMVFQEPRLMPWLNVYDNIKISLLNKKKDDQEQIIMAMLDNLNLKEYFNMWPKELSGGMAQRVSIARALVKKPEVLLLDEPFSALDSFTKKKLHEFVKLLWKKFNLTIVLVTHDIEEAISLSDKIIILKNENIDNEENVKTIEIKRPRENYNLNHYRKYIEKKLA
jgi:sulfonate transport system ATP-binding protein